MSNEFACSDFDLVEQIIAIFSDDDLVRAETFAGLDQPIYVTGRLPRWLTAHVEEKYKPKGPRRVTARPVFECGKQSGFELFWIVGSRRRERFYRIDTAQLAILCRLAKVRQ